MKKIQVDAAVRRALTRFDQWVEVTGFVEKWTGYHGELESIIEDSVHCGIQGALKVKEPLPSQVLNGEDADGNPIDQGPRAIGQYEALVRNAVAGARAHDGKSYRWSVVAKILCVGSTRAQELCRHFGEDPDDELEPITCKHCPLEEYGDD